MSTRKHDGPHAPKRCRGDDGAALIEFAFIGVLLFLLLFGIINFGLILSFRQDVTRAAAEGARGGAVAIPSTGYPTFDLAAKAAADSAQKDAVKQMGGKFKTAGCSTPGMNCAVPIIGPCPSQTSYQCVTVKISFDYEHHPLFGNLPIISEFLPDTIEATSVARINQ